MKPSAANGTVDVLHKIETIEKQVMDLKLSVLKKIHTSENFVLIALDYPHAKVVIA